MVHDMIDDDGGIRLMQLTFWFVGIIIALGFIAVKIGNMFIK